MPLTAREYACQILAAVDLDDSKTKMFLAAHRAKGVLTGYLLPPEVLDRYVCSTCGIRGVKLWRAVHSAQEAWCAHCGTKQAGLPNNIDREGRGPCEFGGLSDQIYSSKKGLNLLPWVPDADGETWGYTSIPSEGVEWWRNLPTNPGDARVWTPE